MDVWTHKNLAYLPIAKNASSTFTHYFKNSGWALTQLDLLSPDFKIFGHFQNPIDRHIKGTVEFLCQHNLVHLIDNPDWQKIFIHAVMDIHSMPIISALGIRAEKIKWIPIHNQIPTLLVTQKWLKAQGYDCSIENLIWENKSSAHKLSLYYKIQDLCQTLNNNGGLNFFYDNDIIHWNSLWPYIDEDNIEYRQY
jgi:hypothetical protein